MNDHPVCEDCSLACGLHERRHEVGCTLSWPIDDEVGVFVRSTERDRFGELENIVNVCSVTRP